MAIDYRVKKKNESSLMLPIALIIAVGYVFKDILFVESVKINPATLPTGVVADGGGIPQELSSQRITDEQREMAFITKTSYKAYQDSLPNDVD